MTGWNQPSANFGFTMMHRDECDIAFSLETAYFGTEDNKISEEKMIELGRCFAKAVKRYCIQWSMLLKTRKLICKT